MRLCTLQEYTRQKVMEKILTIRREFPGCDGLLLSQEEYGILMYFLCLHKASHSMLEETVALKSGTEIWRKMKLDSIFYSVDEKKAITYTEGDALIYLIPIDAEYCDFLEAFIRCSCSIAKMVLNQQFI